MVSAVCVGVVLVSVTAGLLGVSGEHEHPARIASPATARIATTAYWTVRRELPRCMMSLPLTRFVTSIRSVHARSDDPPEAAQTDTETWPDRARRGRSGRPRAPREAEAPGRAQ